MAAPSPLKVHAVATSGFGAGTNALYDRARPSYPPEALSYIKNAVGKDTSLNIVEIASGTGIFTRALLAHPEWQSSIVELRAVEPSEGMRAEFVKSVKDPRITLTEGVFDHTGMEEGWADLVIVAQAFHWCPDYDAACKEFARILRPGGIVVLIWNLEDRYGAPWVAKLRDLYEAFEEGTPQFRLGLWRQTFETESYKKYFGSHEEKIWSYNLIGSVKIVQDRVCSKSYIAIRSEQEKEKICEKVKEIIEEGDGLTWIDKEKGLFDYPYRTAAIIMRKAL